MKKIFSIFITLVACFSFATTVNARPSANNPKFTNCKIVLNGVNFTVDPRVELFHTMEVLSGINLVNYIDLDYKQKMIAYFEPYKDHQLFAYLKKNPLYPKFFGNMIDSPFWFLIHLNNNFDWRKDIPYKEQTPALDSLRMLMKDFAAKSNYPEFFNSNAEFYNISLATLTYNMPNFDEKNRLMDYCGSTNKKGYQFNVILNFLGWGNFGPRIFKADGAELYAVLAPEKVAVRVPTFDVQGLYRLLWHEFAHSFANPAVEKIEEQFLALEHLWPPIKESMRQQAYNSWQSVIKEHMTEAIACRMAALKLGEDAAEMNYVRLQKGKRWIYLNPLLKSLKYYEAHRDTYPTLDSFMPEILKGLKEVKQSDIDQWMAETETFRKPDVKAMPTINDTYDRKDILIITSTNETDKVADEQLKAFINKFKGWVNPLKEAKIVADTTALNMDLSQYNLFVWGTPQGNRFLQKYMSQIPIMVKADKVIAENTYYGTGYGVLIAWVNPLNPKNVMHVYTAQNPANLVDFNQIMNGGGNYHIFRNFITFREGNFSRNGLVWLAK
jgi:hypothetical protein